MNKKILEITENDLHAYVDNQLSKEKTNTVEELIRNDPKVAQQVLEWQQQNAAINQIFNDERFTEVPEQLSVKKLSEKITTDVKPTQKTKSWYFSLAASLLFMVISGSIGWLAHDAFQPIPQNTNSFVNSAISAHQVYSVEVLHPIEVSADKKNHLVAWLSKRVDHPLTVPNLHQYGYKLLGGQLLAMREGRAAAQLMFENTEGKRVTLLISKNPSFRDQSFHLKNNNKINAFYWMDSTIAYSVTGEMDSKTLREISNAVYQQLIPKDKFKHVASL